MASPTTTAAAQLLSISIALLASGGIASLSLFNVPLLQSQPASRSLPQTRWLFSRGSHTFPQAAFLSSAGFAYLAWTAVPSGSFGDLVGLVAKGERKTEDLGGARSEKSAREGDARPGRRSAEESVNAQGVVDELTDLSGPQERTTEESSEEDDREVRELLAKFAALNGLRAVLMGLGGVVGLWTALTV
ncbi:hypothetical protein LTR35_010850 [Friedmanniomyces endolithicus]|uniref:Uncharacterized protein n=1 Tax=Friedmanniomyces endolithicus TaxID=329885 RepID=A0AAN6F8B8_9PEZI|nr:hypothetical protein LTS00_016878 [Friedmanniomyces endolithicus]KAK0275580.1 hypothetical protein LTR35_010850 [Friedmanniomyces endolithicus]KAK0304277.1 hypothetical protein LTR82_017272 [Friedmanniomyces endolithicus]KAK0974690.1 hypothetical protein LTR54_017000 [Friedmanniomyces endolithicus]